jgi:hypothetical protein
VFAGYLASEYVLAALDLYPKLFPKHVFVHDPGRQQGSHETHTSTVGVAERPQACKEPWVPYA